MTFRLFIIVLLLGFGSTNASAAEDQQGKQSLILYGQSFTVTPIAQFDNSLSFAAIKSYISVVLPEATRINYDDLEKVVRQLDFGYADYEEMYWQSIGYLLPKAKKIYPNRSEDELKKEFDQAFRNGQWKALADSYGEIDWSMPPQMLDTQKLYNSYLVFSYLYTMVMESDEIEALSQEGHEGGEGEEGDGHVH
jgi:hypothetical protein